ncbi:MAG: DUF6444 domain-containing protein [Marinifilaceae bacterium]
MSKQHSTLDIQFLLQSFEELTHILKELELENVKLKELISELENKKNRTNSSMPPSSDITKTKKTKSLRESLGKKVGGQIGHKGHTLKMVKNPDEIKEYFPNNCKRYVNDLSEVYAKFSGQRKILDIPPIHPIVTEHRIYTKQCTCGVCTKSEYPETVKSPISYGSNIQALIIYSSIRQYIPVNRIHEVFTDVINVNISEGRICYLLNKMAKKAHFTHSLI